MNLAEATRLIFTAEDRWSVPLAYVRDILHTEEAFTVEEYKHSNISNFKKLLKS